MMAATSWPTPATLRADYRAQDWRPLCPVIDVPVLITAGRHSGALPGCLYAAEHIPGARLVVFEQSGHCPFYTEASRFNPVVADFVTGTLAELADNGFPGGRDERMRRSSGTGHAFREK